MRIIDINIDERYIKNKLKPIVMNKLGQCVVVAGKNGSGKTRLLENIKITLLQKPKENEINNASSQIHSYENNIIQWQKAIESLNQQIKLQPKLRLSNEADIKAYEDSIIMAKNQVEKLNNLGKWLLIETDNYYNEYTTISFVPKNLNIRDCSNDGKQTLSNSENIAKSIGI